MGGWPTGGDGAAAGWALPGYDVEERLGAGATGEVWRARERASGRLVALKRLRCREVAQRDRLRREAALLAGVASAHLVRLRTVVTSGDGLVLVLDLAAGGNLAALLAARGRLPPGEAAAVAGPLARALVDVHAAGLVHGDVSPANVLFTAGGRPLLSDLGSARLVGDGSAPAVSIPYADPAVLAGAEPEPASDVYGWAAVCHAALTGAPPYPGDDPASVLAAVAAGLRRPLAEEVPELPPGFADAVEAALAPEPAARPDAASLAAWLAAAGPPAPLRLAGASVPVSAAPTQQPAPPTAADGSPVPGEPVPPGGPAGPGGAVAGGVPFPAPPPPAAGLGALRARAREAAGPGRWRRRSRGRWRGRWHGRWHGRWRPPAGSRAGPGAGPGAGSRWGARAGAPAPRPSGTGRRPVTPTLPGGAVRAVGLAVAVLATFAGCVAAGTWWARSGAGGAQRLRAVPAAPPGATQAGATSPGSAAPGAAAAGAAEATRFRDVLLRLDATRDAAFATGDVAALRRVYAAGTTALLTDDAKLRALRAEGQRADGLALRLADVRVAATGGAAGGRVTLAVVDELPAYRIVDRAGRIVARVAGRDQARWRIVLRRVGGTWLIAEVGRPSRAGGP